MPTLTNVTISKVYKGASGEGQYGPWQAYNFYVKDKDIKLSCFDSKLTPREGMALVAIEYEEKESHKDGKTYINNNVKNIIMPDTQEEVSNVQRSTSKTPSEPRDGTNSCKADIGPITMWGKYISDIMCAIIKDGHTGQELDERTKDAVETLADSSLMIMGLLKNAQCPKNRGHEKQEEPPSDDIPF